LDGEVNVQREVELSNFSPFFVGGDVVGVEQQLTGDQIVVHRSETVDVDFLVRLGFKLNFWGFERLITGVR
jgi:hypothetical protein